MLPPYSEAGGCASRSSARTLEDRTHRVRVRGRHTTARPRCDPHWKVPNAYPEPDPSPPSARRLESASVGFVADQPITRSRWTAGTGSPRGLMPAGQFASATSEAHVAKLGPLFQKRVSKSSAFNRKRENGKRKGGKRDTGQAPHIDVTANPFPGSRRSLSPFPVSRFPPFLNSPPTRPLPTDLNSVARRRPYTCFLDSTESNRESRYPYRR